jgi:hypothetical protein
LKGKEGRGEENFVLFFTFAGINASSVIEGKRR